MFNDLIYSWKNVQGIHTTEEILAWIKGRYDTLTVNINPCTLSNCDPWYYNESRGCIQNRRGTFFSISALEIHDINGSFISEQPIIHQKEIGIIGIICKKIDNVIHLLMQAKVEPGNINTVQLSPTIQATKSNFMQEHGGQKQPYLEYFLNVKENKIVCDQIQSEQSSRFYKKRNRNLVILLDDMSEVEVLSSHRWMTIGQIKGLMKIPNLVNMDTRTVLSCIPFSLMDNNLITYSTTPLLNSILAKPSIDKIMSIYRHMNDIKMFNTHQVRFKKLHTLSSWVMDDQRIYCKSPHPFQIIYCDIHIEGREINRWSQPLLKANGVAVFGLFMRVYNQKTEFLIQYKTEIGCLDVVELGPTVQRESIDYDELSQIETLFFDKLKNREGIRFNNILSEEGGRFYHEQNQNVIIEVEETELDPIPEGYIWNDYSTLNHLIQINNCLNIQLRNLLSVLDAPV